MKRSDATRRALLAAARDEFAEHGLAGARVDRVAELAGVNKERIYSLFGSKEKLFDAIIVDTLQEVTGLIDPLDTETDLGDYVAKLFDFHRENPQLQRLLLWEALHRGDEAHDIDGWRDAHFRHKVVAAMARFGVDEQHAGLLVLVMACLANWPNATPQQTRLLLGELADRPATIRDFLAEFFRTAMRTHEAELAQAAAEPGSAPESPAAVGDRSTPEPVNSLTGDVDAAARRLRHAQTAADAARAELGRCLRAANDAGDSANQLAKQVAGTVSRPVVLKLLAETE